MRSGLQVRDDFLQSYLDKLFSQPSCSWCKRQLYGKRVGLCGSCRSISVAIRKLEKRSPLSQGLTQIGNELAVWERMKEVAEAEGIEFGNINAKDVTGFDLEHAFNEVSRRVAHKELFDDWAQLFELAYTMPQRRLLYFHLSEVIRMNRRRHRKTRARWDLVDDLREG